MPGPDAGCRLPGPTRDSDVGRRTRAWGPDSEADTVCAAPDSDVGRRSWTHDPEADTGCTAPGQRRTRTRRETSEPVDLQAARAVSGQTRSV